MKGRISFSPPNQHSTFFGTVRYSGVVGTTGDWLGIEWDDSSRGKHDGTHDGIQYFVCSVQGSGSFIRPNAKGLEFGTSFVKAIRNKYIISREEKEDQKDDSSQFYKSNGNFEIEVILKPQKGKRRELKELKEIGLEGDGVSTAGTEEELEQLALELLNIHVLNLSFSLLSAWSEILAIVRSLKVSLRTLSISSNRFEAVSIGTSMNFSPFSNLTCLVLNSTRVDWSQICALATGLSSLQELQLGFNHISQLSTAPPPNSFLRLKTLNLEGNDLELWQDLEIALGGLQSLDTLILNSNRISNISISIDNFMDLRKLEISNNLINNWKSIDSLNQIRLSHLAIKDNQFSNQDIRTMIIGRIGSIRFLENSVILTGERIEAERLLLRSLMTMSFSIPVARIEQLKLFHGSQNAEEKLEIAAKNIKSKLITLFITLPPSVNSSDLSLEILPTLSTRQLRIKLSKLLNPVMPLKKADWKFIGWLNSVTSVEDGKIFDGEKTRRELNFEIPLEEEGRELSYWGLMDGDRLELIAV